MNDREKLISLILESKHSHIAKLILIKSLFLPDDWNWNKAWMIGYFKLTVRQWDKVSAELRKSGDMKYIKTSIGKGNIETKMELKCNSV